MLSREVSLYHASLCVDQNVDDWMRVGILLQNREIIDKKFQLASTGCPKKVSIKNFNSDLLVTLIHSF